MVDKASLDKKLDNAISTKRVSSKHVSSEIVLDGEKERVINETSPSETSPSETSPAETSLAETSLGDGKEQAETSTAAEGVEPGESDDGADKGYLKHVQNWKALRESKNKAEHERIKLQHERDALAAQYGVPPAQKEEAPSLNDDDLAEGKHLKYYQNRTEQKISELESRLVEAQIRAKYNDFDEVVNQDTIGMLRDTDPYLADSLAANPNPYSQAIAVYNSIKRYGLDRSTFENERKTINRNSSKPRTVNSLNPQRSESPLARANAFAEGLTDDRKEARWKEAQRVLSGS